VLFRSERVDLFSIPPSFVFKPTLENYIQAFIAKGFSRNLENSFIAAALSTAIALLIGVPGSYGLSRSKMKGDGALLILTLVIRMAPPIIIAVPFYILVVKLKLLTTVIGIVLAHSVLTLPLLVWMMKNFFDTIPADIEEAAIIDGCSMAGAFLRVSLPLVLGGLSATVIICIITSWNEYLLASVLTTFKTVTLPVAIPNLITSKGTAWGEICAIGTVVSLPIAIFTILVQKYLVKGMTMGAIK
jgi:multiple sugar transport system permease protein